MLSFIHLRTFTRPIPLLTLTFTLGRALSVLLLLLSHLPLGEASTITPRSSAAVNRTIDDELGDSVTGLQPIYSPQADWNQGATCTTCHIGTGLIDPTRVFGGTWHDSTTYPDDPPHTVAATFTGTAVYVFNIVVNAVPDTATLTNLTFFLDGERAGEFVHEPDGSSDVSYNVPVFTTAGLANVPHTLLIQMNAPNITNVLFDYIVYTAEEEDDTTTVTSLLALETASPDSSPTHFRGGHHGSHLPVGAIVGGILGGLAIVALVIAAILYFRKRPQRRQGKPLGDDMEKQLRDNREGSPSPFTKRDPGPLQLSPSASVIEISTAHIHAEPVPVLSPGVSSEGEFDHECSPWIPDAEHPSHEQNPRNRNGPIYHHRSHPKTTRQQ
ncbi:hypothetical protein GY45DRAFT_1327351 [Cubamyces sp. BRFM 1775]|nr:hypothetical protein GY45DRAFT_1327351 [Cubamyces sp. BRFM 1775]